MKKFFNEKRNAFSMFLVGLILFTSSSVFPSSALVNNGTTTLPYSIAEAMSIQNGSTAFVKGYVVGQPVSSTQVLKSSFTGDTAIALADLPTETNTSKMLYVQIPTQFRTQFGLASTPSLLGSSTKFSGSLTAYFTHQGLKNVTSAVKVTSGGDTGGDTGGTPGGTTSPYDSTYYASALSLSGETLKTQLHNIIKGNTAISYDAVWAALRLTDEDPNNSNNVILLYTGRSQSKLTNGGYPNDWNREHVWAKSHGDFGTATGAGTDLHHLRPTDVSVNADRSNLDFDMGGTAHPEATQCKYDSDSWEPRDSVKGDVARMLFYMAVRYEGTDGEVDLELNNIVNNGSDPFFGKLSVLLQWNSSDPVDSFEMKRNNVIYDKYQHNRNPFIDHPEWATSIWGSN